MERRDTGLELPVGKSRRLKIDKGHLMRDGNCLWLEGMVKALDTGRTGLSLEKCYARMLAELFDKRPCSLLQSA